MTMEIGIRPLTKRKLSGELYTRVPKIEEHLAGLSELTRDELVMRAAILDKHDEKYVPSECLVYFIRASRDDSGEVWFERLYRLLAERVLKTLPREINSDGKSVSVTNLAIRDKVFDRFTKLLLLDRAEGTNKLDFYEIRFDSALAKLRKTARKQAWRDENRSAPLEYDSETQELHEEVERAAGSFDLIDHPNFDDPDYRLRWEAAIDTLPEEQMRIIEMLRKEIPIDSKDPEVVTISKALEKSEKTIRTYRDKAFASLRTVLEGDDQ